MAVLAGPAAWSVATAATPHTGSIVTAGPVVAVGRGFGPGGAGGPGGTGGTGGTGGAGGRPGRLGGGREPAGGGAPFPGLTPGPAPGATAAPPGPGTEGLGAGLGGLLGSSGPSAEVTALLAEDADAFRWVAATTGSNHASGDQLATELPVMAIGGFNGSDPSPTLEQFQDLVAAGDIHWYVASGIEQVGSAGGSREATRIATWVAAAYPARQVGGVTLYDLS